MYQNHVLQLVQFSERDTFVANPRKRCTLFQTQTPCCLQQEIWWYKFLVREKITHRPQLGLSHHISKKLQQKVGAENFFDLSSIICKISKNVSACSTASLQMFDCNASLLPATTRFFPQCLSSYAFGSSFEIFLSANNISCLWHCKFQQISTHALSGWDVMFSQERIVGSPNILRKSSKTTPTLTSNIFVVGKFKNLMKPFYKIILIQMNVGNFSKHENKSSYSHRDKGSLLTRRVSQISVYAVNIVFQQSSKLKIAQSLIVHDCPVVNMSPYLSLDMNGKQRNKGASVSPTKLYSTRSL